jgi:hypothetical protein
MKWYSVKEHDPVLSICCVLLAARSKATGAIYLWLGEWDDEDSSWKGWDDEEDIEETYDVEVTHFCYPDPIPKVYDKLVEDKGN